MNAVHLEMVKMGRKWQQEVKKNPDAVSYVLLGQKPQTQLFETYCKYQLSDESNTDDTYLTFFQPFETQEKYSESLLKELTEVYQLWQKEHAEAVDWQLITTQAIEENAAAYFIDNLLALLNLYPVLKKYKVFIHAAPTAMSNRTAYEAWITACGKHIEKSNAHSFMKLVFTEHEQHRVIKNFYKPHYWQHPIDIANLMEKTAESTNKNKGATENNFQQLILKAGNFLGKQQYQEADTMLTQAIKIATETKSNQGVVLATLIKAQNFQAQQKQDDAALMYEQIIQHNTKDAPMLVQVYFAYGAFLLANKEKNKALAMFEKAAELGQQTQDTITQIEANRLMGQLHDGALTQTLAATYYQKCINLGQQLTAVERTESSLPYIGSLLTKIYGVGTEKGNSLHQTMTDWFGENWQQKITIPDFQNKKFVA
jgi:Tfp pilus assembly protein PilF